MHTVRLPLQPHARGTVNAYLVETGDGPVLVDTGFHSTVTILSDALAAAGVERGGLRATLITHNHADHIGAARWLRANDWYAARGELVLHELTARVGRGVFVELDRRQRRQLLDNGIPADQVVEWESDLAAMAGLADWPSPDRLVRGGDTLEYGGVRFTFRHTPGHSPDHCAIVAEFDGRAVVFLGDLTLGRGMPRVGVRDWHRPDPIQDLLASWDTVRGLDAVVALPGHGRPIHDLRGLDADIRAAYQRWRDTFVERHRGRLVSAAEIMLGTVDPGEPFGVRQFVFYESLAMLAHLHRRGQARRLPGHPIRYEIG